MIENKPRLLQVMDSEGIKVDHHGKFVCPFHDDTSPSGKVYGEHWKCFGCGAHGDVIDIVMRMNDLTFQDAIEVLGLKGDKPRPEVIQRARSKREMISLLEKWRIQYMCALTDRLRDLMNLEAEIEEDPMIDGEDPWDRVALTQEIPQIQYMIDTLMGADRETLIRIYEDFIKGGNESDATAKPLQRSLR